MASSSGISHFEDLVSVDEFPKGHRNENNRKKTKENIALLKDFFLRKNESRAQEKFCYTNSIHSFTNEKTMKIITPVHCVVWLPALKGILQNYGHIIIKDAEFEENVNGLKVKTKTWRRIEEGQSQQARSFLLGAVYSRNWGQFSISINP